MIEKDKVELKERPSSVEVSQNAKGQFSHSIKIYFNELERTNESIIDQIKNIHELIKKRFK